MLKAVQQCGRMAKGVDMINSTKSLNEYLTLTSTFIIPYYQRGYIWGKKRDSDKDSAVFMIDSIMAAFQKKQELFLQGITAARKNSELILIDGQQRTTFFYLLLHYLGLKHKFKIRYEIRKESDMFLQNIAAASQKSRDELVKLAKKDQTEQHQDIYYFKKTIQILHNVLKDKDSDELNSLTVFLGEKIKFLYIEIPEDKAATVFSMMNGTKAQMTSPELIKAELLRLVSLDTDEEQSKRWEQILLRGKYAREWDRWLYWWNRNSVKKFYCIEDQSDNMLGLLLTTYYEIHNKKNTQYSFAEFKRNYLEGDSTDKVHRLFYDLRRLQKKFEDVYNSSSDEKKLHNKIGAIIKIFKKSDREKFLVDYFSGTITQNELEKWYKYVFLNLTYEKIKKALADEKESKKDEDSESIIKNAVADLINAVSDDELYNNGDHKQYAYLQLFRLNIEEDTKLGRAFDFSCWDSGKKSLEHILPQSKASGETEHCIGNLVLLYKNENSAFGNKNFEDKKRMYFNFTENFKSRHLLHTMSVFAESHWDSDTIKKNKEKIIQEITAYYD